MNKPNTSATKLRAALSVIVILIVILAGVGFYYAQDWLSEQSKEVHQIVSTSNAGKNDTQSVAELQKAISDRQEASDKATSILTNANTYTEQVIGDLEKHASQAGIKIADYKFSADSTTPDSQAPATSATTISGVRTIPISITLANPVNFTNLLRFMKAIETNLPKMQINGISLTSTSGSPGTVTVAPITIEVFAR
jgi:hypothetical protein